MPLECLSCHGTYEPIQPDGTLYFHRCPPLSVAELKAGLADGSVSLPPAAAAQLQAAQAADARTPPKPDQAAHADLVLARLVVERPNVRDENVTDPRDPRTPPTLKAAGAGVRQVA